MADDSIDIFKHQPCKTEITPIIVSRDPFRNDSEPAKRKPLEAKIEADGVYVNEDPFRLH